MMFYDKLGSYFAEIFENDTVLASIFLIVPFTNIPLKRFYSSKAFFLGKTAMTSTGKATIIAAVFIASTSLVNAHFERGAMNSRAKAEQDAMNARDERNRAYQNAQDERNRAYQNYQDARKDYNSTPLYKKRGKEPSWDEATWKDWSKTK